MSLYLILDLAVVVFPLILSFDRKVAFYRHWPSVFLSIVIVGAVYVVWDVFATRRGDWAFNESYTMKLRIFGLPLEEILFFVVVPYACLFVYEVVRAYIPEAGVPIPPALPALLGVGFVAAAMVFHTQPYTLTVLATTGVFLLFGAAIVPHAFQSSWFWIALGISYIPFLIANGVLTGLPVVRYGVGHIWGIRVTSIPLEDFFYSLSLLGFNYLLHILFRTRLHIGG